MRVFYVLGALALGGLLSASFLSHRGEAAVYTTGATVPLTPTNYTSPVLIDRFDPSLGELRNVMVCFVGIVDRQLAAENLSAAPASISFGNIETVFGVALPGQDVESTPLMMLDTMIEPFTTPVTAFDGQVDFGGTSGFDTGVIRQSTMGEWESNDPRTLALFTGTGQTSLEVLGDGSTMVLGPSNMQARSSANIALRVSVFYTYIPAP